MRQRCVALIFEDQFTGCCLLTAKTTFMNQVMVMPAEQNQVIQVGLSAICPVFYVVPIHVFVVRTARETASCVSEAQCTSHCWWN